MNPPALFGSDAALDLPVTDPLELLARWLAKAGADQSGTDSTTTPLMALATVDDEGYPRVRHVLLSAHDGDGLHFHTDTRSSKSAELAATPHAAATIVWPDIPRQVSVSGTVRREPEELASAAFAARSRYLQLLAWVNTDELAQRPAPERAAAFSAYDLAHPTLAPPDTWAGYVLVPQRITFWRGGPEGPSQRVACHLHGDGWSVQLLPG